MVREEATKIARKEIEDARQQAGYGVSLIPYHTHNGIDSPRLVSPGAGGADTEIQYNSGGVLTGSSDLIWSGSNVLTIHGDIQFTASDNLGEEANIIVGAATVTNENGADLQVSAGSGDGTGDGGLLKLNAGYDGGSGDLGNVEINLLTSSLSTSSNGGFVSIPSMAGTPTGTPSASNNGIPMVYDRTNNKLYAYNGAWKSVTLT